MIRGGGSFTRISNNVGPQIPVLSDNVPDLTARDVHVAGEEAVRPLETVAPVSDAVQIHTRRCSSDSEDSDDDVLPVGALIPLDRLALCCAQLDDFGWEVPDCVPGMLLPEQDSDVERTKLSQAVLPDVFPVVSAEVADVPWPVLAVDVYVPQAKFIRETAPSVVLLIEEMLIGVMSGRDTEVGLLPDVFPVVSAEVAAVPWPLPAVDVFVPEAIFEREAAPLVVSLKEATSVRVMSGRGMEVGLTGLTLDIQVSGHN